jgi:predicted  nucleic acid-binding Zn-ribbon protein
LEADCIDASFTEMREEGYADDGLFSTMGEFFLPLTISEQELSKTRASAGGQARQEQLKDFTEEVDRLTPLLAEATMHRWDVDEKITDLNRTMDEAYIVYINDRSQVSATLTAREQAEELQQIDRQWQYNRRQFEKNMVDYKNTMEQWISRISDYDRQIDELNTQINNIKTELSQPQRPVDKGLVKPARGFIMYGPPGMKVSL